MFYILDVQLGLFNFVHNQQDILLYSSTYASKTNNIKIFYYFYLN